MMQKKPGKTEENNQRLNGLADRLREAFEVGLVAEALSLGVVLLLCIRLLISLADLRQAASKATPGLVAPGTAGMQALDLTRRMWLVKSGFNPKQTTGFDPASPGVVPITVFPISLNRLMSVPPGPQIHEFTLMTVVDLPAGMVQAPLGIALADIGENWEVYLNGRLLRSEVYRASDGTLRILRRVQNVVLPIPPGGIHSGPNTLVVHIAGSAPSVGFLPGAGVGFPQASGYSLGPLEAMEDVRLRNTALDWAGMGACLIFAFYELMFFRRNPRVRFHLHFGLFLLAVGVSLGLASPLAYDLYLDTSVLTRLSLASMMVAVPALSILSLWDFLFDGRPPAMLRVLEYWSLLGALIVMIVSFRWLELVVYAFLPAVGLGLVYLAYLLVRALRQGRPDAVPVSVAGVATFMLGTWMVIDSQLLHLGLPWSGLLPTVLVMLFLFIFISRTIRNVTALSETNRVLRDSRDELQARLAAVNEQLKVTDDQLQAQLVENHMLAATLRDQTIRDPLTGLFNRRYLEETLEREMARAGRECRQVSLVIMAIDGFRMINETFGHKAGDRVLQALARLTIAQTRQSDVACRSGDAEFLIILPGAPLQVAQDRAEAWCQAARGLRVQSDGQVMATTISLGVAAFPDHGSSTAALLQATETALITAKRSGRNCVRVAQLPNLPS